MSKTKLTPINTKNPEELRKSLQEASNLSRISGGRGHTPKQIERIIHLHCSKGFSLEQSVAKALEETDKKGHLAELRKRAEQILKERKNNN